MYMNMYIQHTRIEVPTSQRGIRYSSMKKPLFYEGTSSCTDLVQTLEPLLPEIRSNFICAGIIPANIEELIRSELVSAGEYKDSRRNGDQSCVNKTLDARKQNRGCRLGRICKFVPVHYVLLFCRSF